MLYEATIRSEKGRILHFDARGPNPDDALTDLERRGLYYATEAGGDRILRIVPAERSKGLASA